MKHLRWILPVAAVLLLAAFLLQRPGGDGDGPLPDPRGGDSPLLEGEVAPADAVLVRRSSEGRGGHVPAEVERTDAENGLRGTVRDDSGAPVEAAVVYFMRVTVPDTLVYAGMEQAATRAVSAANGTYRSSLEPGLYVVRARKGDLESVRREVRVPRREPLDLEVVAATASITVRFHARDAGIELRGLEPRVIANRGKVQPIDGRGEVRITGLRTGDVISLHVILGSKDRSLAILPPPGVRREYLIGARRMQTVITVEEASTAHVFPVARLARIHGLLLDDSGGAPHAAYTLTARQTGSSWSPQGEIDTSNPTPTYSVWVLPERQTSLFVPPTPLVHPALGTRGPVLVGPLGSGEAMSLDLHLAEAPHEVRGRIVDLDGRPLRRVGVRVIQYVPSGLPDAVDADPYVAIVNGGTEADGTFELDGLLAYPSVLDVAPPRDARGVAPLPIPIADWGRGTESMGTIPLPEGGSIAGTLQVLGGKSTGATRKISIRIIPAKPDGRPHTARRHTTPVECRDGATFLVENLAPGRYRLLGSGTLRETWGSPLGEVDVVPGETSAIRVAVSPR